MIPSEAIICFEAGSGEQLPCCASLENIGGDLESLERLAQERVIDLNVKGDIVTVKGRDRVGMIILASGRRLMIRTKIPNAALLDWLMYLGEIPCLLTCRCPLPVRRAGRLRRARRERRTPRIRPQFQPASSLWQQILQR